MSEQCSNTGNVEMSESDEEQISQLHSDIDTAAKSLFDCAQALMDGGVRLSAVAMALSMTYADLIALLASEADDAVVESIDVVIDMVAKDIKKRALNSFEFYKKMNAEQVEAVVETSAGTEKAAG